MPNYGIDILVKKNSKENHREICLCVVVVGFRFKKICGFWGLKPFFEDELGFKTIKKENYVNSLWTVQRCEQYPKNPYQGKTYSLMKENPWLMAHTQKLNNYLNTLYSRITK